jgi:hypothetical protein
MEIFYNTVRKLLEDDGLLGLLLGRVLCYSKCVAWLGSSPLWLKVMVNVAKRSREISATLRYFQWMDMENGGDLLNL